MDNVEQHPAQVIPSEGEQVVRVVSTFQDITALQRTAQGQYLLAEASRALATSLDYLAGMESLVRLVVTVLADWSLINRVVEYESVCRIAITQSTHVIIEHAIH